ncbi:twin-arginine translocation signal domain-containing protein [SAR202 cluster bacterium AD-804-J14_MRT_500m]|nr:twin-arginine translocation signal domain-containing protein [SAR202 cluster bacterium AD-804-J14_MRT_500m]
MNKEHKSMSVASLTRRNFLGVLSLGVAGIAGIGLSMNKLMPENKEPSGPQAGIPEDSIFKPRENQGNAEDQNKA